MSPRPASALLASSFFSTDVQLQSADLGRVGTYDFPTSAEAQKAFLTGVGFLHSFGLTQAQEAFREAQQHDPDFVMAYGGEAFTFQHPLSGALSEGPGLALIKLAPTPALRAAKAQNDKERGFLQAASDATRRTLLCGKPGSLLPSTRWAQ